MSERRIHRALSADGTEIAARVEGSGPPLVLVHGAFADGELEWGRLLPRLARHFTCYAMSTRGRGPSGDQADHSPRRLVQDVRALVDSVGVPAALAGVSGGGMHALGAAAGNASVQALAIYEPPVFEAVGEEEFTDFGHTVAAAAHAVARGEPTQAARTFLGFVANDAERQLLAQAHEELAQAGRYAVTDLLELQHHMGRTDGAGSTAPSTLAAIDAPVLVLHGSATARRWFTAGARYVTGHVSRAEAREIDNAGHLAIALGDERVADELIDYLGSRTV